MVHPCSILALVTCCSVLLAQAALQQMALDSAGAHYFKRARGTGFALAKLDLNGTLLWNNSVASTGLDHGTDMCTDAEDNLYMTGFTRGGSAGDFDIVILAYDSDGRMLWRRQIGTPHHDEGRYIYFHGGSLYVVGHTWGMLDDRAHAGAGFLRGGERDGLPRRLKGEREVGVRGFDMEREKFRSKKKEQ